MDLSPLQRDAITELLNIGVGRAAAALSDMVEQEVELTVPHLEFVTFDGVQAHLEAQFGEEITVLRQRFVGEFWGDALLLIPKRRSMALVREVMRDTLPLDSLGALEQEALLEIGNVILNACVGGMANAFGEEITVELPDYIETDASLSFAAPEDVNGGVMLLKMDFRIQGRDIRGFLAFLLDMESLDSFLVLVERFLGVES